MKLGVWRLWRIELDMVGYYVDEAKDITERMWNYTTWERGHFGIFFENVFWIMQLQICNEITYVSWETYVLEPKISP